MPPEASVCGRCGAVDSETVGPLELWRRQVPSEIRRTAVGTRERCRPSPPRLCDNVGGCWPFAVDLAVADD